MGLQRSYRGRGAAGRRGWAARRTSLIVAAAVVAVAAPASLATYGAASASASVGQCNSGYFCEWSGSGFTGSFDEYFNNANIYAYTSFYNDSNQNNYAWLYPCYDQGCTAVGSYSPGYATGQSHWAGGLDSFRWDQYAW